MIVIGLTGSIGMGKSTVSQMFREAGVPVHDADKAVHELYEKEAVPLIETAFPGTTGPNGVDRQKLAQIVIGNDAAMKQLESLIHPLVRADQAAFLARAKAAGSRIAVLDIPLLFEAGRENDCDHILVVTASAAQQTARVLARPGMSAEKLKALLARQMPDSEKRTRADSVIDNSGSMEETRKQVLALIARFHHGSM
jgi:dephospho-CoA kinase